MLIVIEGPDGAGKSMLAYTLSRLAEKDHVLPWVLHTSQPMLGEDLRQTYLNGLEFYSPSLLHEYLVVCDRWHLGELIYGPIFRGRSQLEEADVDRIDNMIARKGGIRLFLDAPDQILVQNAFSRGEDFVRGPVELIDIAVKYREHAQHFGWRYRSNGGTYEAMDALAFEIYVSSKQLEAKVAMEQ